MRSFLTLVLFSAWASASFVPTAPGPGEVYHVGSPCTIKWQIDATGLWTNVTIDLMSGSNEDMTLVRNVALGLDGTNPAVSPFNWTCPDVTPYSAIYFYQFTNNQDIASSQWTARFTISSADGSSVPPAHATQPNGDTVAWGVGRLLRDNGDPYAGTVHHVGSSLPATGSGEEQGDTSDELSDSDPGSPIPSTPSQKLRDSTPTATLIQTVDRTAKSHLPPAPPTRSLAPTLYLPPDLAAKESALAATRMDAVNGATERGVVYRYTAPCLGGIVAFLSL